MKMYINQGFMIIQNKTNSEYCRIAPSVMKEISKKLESGTSVSNSHRFS